MLNASMLACTPRRMHHGAIPMYRGRGHRDFSASRCIRTGLKMGRVLHLRAPHVAGVAARARCAAGSGMLAPSWPHPRAPGPRQETG